jgi:trafficking protein particle complex subunit 9
MMEKRKHSCPLFSVSLNQNIRSTIRITVENVSSMPIEFIRVTCTDSTMAPAQQALTDGQLSVFETYETEYELLHRPVFQWNMDSEPSSIAPGRRAVLTIICSGKVGW